MYKAFCTYKKQMIMSGYPRCDILLNPKSDYEFSDSTINSIREKIQYYKNNNYTIMGYFPTYREKHIEFILGTNNHYDLAEFDSFLDDSKIILFTKRHYANNNYEGLLNYNNMIELPSILDINAILPMFDALITDYSGIYFDFLLLDRPIILFIYDYDQYKSERGFIFNFRKYMAGAKANSLQELKIEILNILKGIDPYHEKRKLMKKLIYNKIDSSSSKRLYNKLSKL